MATQSPSPTASKTPSLAPKLIATSIPSPVPTASAFPGLDTQKITDTVEYLKKEADALRLTATNGARLTLADVEVRIKAIMMGAVERLGLDSKMYEQKSGSQIHDELQSIVSRQGYLFNFATAKAFKARLNPITNQPENLRDTGFYGANLHLWKVEVPPKLYDLSKVNTGKFDLGVSGKVPVYNITEVLAAPENSMHNIGTTVERLSDGKPIIGINIAGVQESAVNRRAEYFDAYRWVLNNELGHAALQTAAHQNGHMDLGFQLDSRQVSDAFSDYVAAVNHEGKAIMYATMADNETEGVLSQSLAARALKETIAESKAMGLITLERATELNRVSRDPAAVLETLLGYLEIGELYRKKTLAIYEDGVSPGVAKFTSR